MSKTKFWHCVASGIISLSVLASPALLFAQGEVTILKPADMANILPATVFYLGQSATTQVRNSGGVKFTDGHMVLATLVDTSGYSTGVAAKYQAYFITEVPIRIGGQQLPPGAYGVGFVDDNKFVVTDLGANEVFTVSSKNDTDMKRPMPLQVLTDPAHGFRLYAGRRYVIFER